MFKRLTALIEARATIASLVGDACCTYFHDNIPTRANKAFARDCVECFVRSAEPIRLIDQADDAGHFKMDGLPTFGVDTLEYLANEAIEFEW